MRKLLILLTGLILLNPYNYCINKEAKSIDSNIVDKQTINTDNILEHIDKKGEWFKIDTKFFLTPDSLSKDFMEFHLKFITDSIFQRDHIQFPMLAAIIECETTIQLNESNWKYYNYDFLKNFYNTLDSNVIYQNETKFYYQQYRKEIGLLFRIGFEKQGGRWFLILYEEIAC